MGEFVFQSAAPDRRALCAADAAHRRILELADMTENPRHCF